MMLKINKSREKSFIRVVWDFYPNNEDTQTMILYDRYSKNEYTIDLGFNSSNSTYRYGRYLIEKEELKDIGEGDYLYLIYNHSNINMCEATFPLAKGILRVEYSKRDEKVQDRKPIVLKEDKEDSKYIVFDDSNL